MSGVVAFEGELNAIVKEVSKESAHMCVTNIANHLLISNMFYHHILFLLGC